MGAKLEQLLPQGGEVSGFGQTGEVQRFAGEQLVYYIDGGAELYFAYDFQEAVACEYHITDGARTMVEIYRMDRPENAYGVYSLDTGGSHPDVGQEATYAAGLLTFWRGSFFVRILADSATTEAEQAVIRVGKSIAGKIDEQGSKPAIVECVPGSGIVPESLQFFHKQICLNNIYYIADDNLLRLNEKTDAISYLYRVEGRSVRVILVQYPDEDAASSAFGNFVRTYLERDDVPENRDPVTVGQVENDTYCGAKRTDKFLVLAFEASDREACKDVLETASGSLNRAESHEEEKQ